MTKVRQLACAAVFCASLGMAHGQDRDVHAAYDAVRDAEVRGREQGEREQAASIVAAWHRNFGWLSSGETRLGTLDDESLRLAFDATRVALFYSHQPGLLDGLEALAAELQRRGALDDERSRQVHQSMVGLRRFEEASAHALHNPHLSFETMPRIEPSGAVGALYAVAAGDRIRLQPLLPEGGVHVVVVSHPACAFSRAAMAAAASDASLSRRLDGVLWIAPPDERLQLDQIASWNERHPTTPIQLAGPRSAWPMLDTWATPTFYLIAQGKVVKQFSGWPREAGDRNLARLRDLLDRRDDLLRGMEAERRTIR